MKILKKRRKIFLIDVSHIIYVCYFGLAERDRDAQNISAKFLNRVLQIIDENDTTDLVFCWDSPTSIRKDRYSFYKEKRHSKPDPNMQYLHEAKDNLKTILPAMGFNASIEVDGYEADDTTCEMVRRYPMIDFIIVANDNDLFQILRYSNLKGLFSCTNNGMTTKKSAIQKTGIHPRDWHLFKAIGGCKSDEVPGIPGIGKVYATKFLQGILPEDSKAMVTIYEHRNTTFLRNHWLVTLPLPGLTHIDMPLVPNQVTKKKLSTVATVYNIYFSSKWKKVIKRTRKHENWK